MKPRIKIITLAVDDLERSLAFYRDGMGLETKGITGTQFEGGAVVFFHLDDNLILAVWPATSLELDSGVSPTLERTGAVSLGHLVASPSQVDAVLDQAHRAGARIVDPARKRFWGGYSGYFSDPDGHLWEIAWNPSFTVAD